MTAGVQEQGSILYILVAGYSRIAPQILVFLLSAHTLALFIAFLAQKNYATVSSYISALSFPHRLACVPDPTKSEMIKLAYHFGTQSHLCIAKN